MGGKFHLKLNMDERPIANKYREGKMKRTLKRELKVLEIVKKEAIGTSRMHVYSSIRDGIVVGGLLEESSVASGRSSTGIS